MITISDLYSEILNKSNIINVLSYYGISVNNGKAICPFHNDTNPSLVVTSEKGNKKNLFHCFSCEAGGNVISFVKKYEKEINHNEISTDDALLKVAEICNLDIDVSHLKNNQDNYQYTTTTRRYTKEERELIEVNNYLVKLFNYNLTAVRDKPLQYLHDRGLSDEIIKSMNLGYFQKGQLLQLAKNPNSKISAQQLVSLGLLKLGDSGYYEPFVDRIMFPIKDEKGNIITFAGRVLDDSTPKYLHTEETALFHKKELLYNYSDAKNYSYNNELFLVEGYMDVIGAKKLGIDNVCALMGTAITDEHLKLLKKNKSTLILALDNDFKNEKNNIGREAMLKKIPDLIKEGFNVEVLDISKIGNYKDFGDLAENNIPREDIRKSQVSAFEFYMDYHYFRDKELKVSTIHDIFEEAKRDKFIVSTFDESLYKEYILNKTSFKKEELEEILYPKDINNKKNPINNFQSIVMDTFIKNNLGEFLEKRKDKVLSGYYEINQDMLNNQLVKLFHSNPAKYLSKNAMKLNIALLLYDALNQDSKYAEYETLHKFKYEDLFNKTYIKNKNGSARVELTFDQKEQIIKQYEEGLSDKDKLALEEVEEIYIINDVSDLDGILSYDNDIMKIFKGNIQDRMFLNQNNMDFFKYGSLFLNINKEFISNDFKGRTGNFKTILFYNNLDGKMKIEKTQLTKDEVDIVENSKDEIQSKQKEESKDYVFSINQILLCPDMETNSHYFVRIPNTNAKDYFYLPKDECNWSDKMIFTKLKSDMKYKVYNRSGNFKYEKNAEELKHFWEDKTNKTTKSVFETKALEQSKEEPAEINSTEENEKVLPFFPVKEPVCKVAKSRILDETANGYYFKTSDRNVLLYATKKICNWNQDQSYLILHPKKNFLTGTGISKYIYDGNIKTFEKRVAFNELGNYLKIFYPASYKKINKEKIEIAKNKCEFASNFLKIPARIHNVLGYVSINKIKCVDTGKTITLELSPNEQLSFYTKEGSYIGNYGIQEIKEGISSLNNKILPFNRKDCIDFNKLMSSYKEVTYNSGLDKLEFIPTTIEPDYESFETVVHVKLNDSYLYKPEGKNIAPYKNQLVQNGMFKKAEDVVAFLETYFSGRELIPENKDLNIEKEVA